MRTLFLTWLLTAVLLRAPTAIAADAYRTPAIAPAEVERLLTAQPPPLIIDLREPVEFRVAHLPGARNIEPAALEGHLEEIRAAHPAVLYCIIGKRTREAEQILSAYDLPHLYHLEGGIGAWIRSGRPVEKGDAARPTGDVAR